MCILLLGSIRQKGKVLQNTYHPNDCVLVKYKCTVTFNTLQHSYKNLQMQMEEVSDGSPGAHPGIVNSLKLRQNKLFTVKYLDRN